jgi:hypothetical protein
MVKFLLAAALMIAAVSFAHHAQAQTGQRCVPTMGSKGKTILVCGSAQPGVYNPARCRKVYNSYTRRMETLC